MNGNHGKPVVVYGASGYTGRLVCEYLREYNVPFVAAGLLLSPGVAQMYTKGETTTSSRRTPSERASGQHRPTPNAISSSESSRARLASVVAIDEPHPHPSALELL